MTFQIDYNGDGDWKNAYPDGYGMHRSDGIAARALGASNCINSFFEVTHFDLQQIEVEMLQQEQSSLATEHSRDSFQKDLAALRKALTEKEAGRTVLHGQDEDGHYFLVLVIDKDGDILLDKARTEYTVFHDGAECESCWSPESGDVDVWFAAIFADGAEAARAGSTEYTREEWEAKQQAA